jgi:DNA polymerase-1
LSKRYVLVDGNALVHAAWHGYPEQIGSDGLSYRAVHGFLSKMHRMDRDYQWDELLVVFDPPDGSLYRKSIFPGYKAHRPEPDPDLRRQLNLIETVIRELGFSTLKVPGVESDDAIGTLAKVAAAKGMMVMIVTPDKDMSQLVNEQVGLLRPLRGAEAIEVPFDYMGPEGVVQKYGVEPRQIADWLALIGDVSDNIPGVKGVGPKIASRLMAQYGDIRTVMTNADKIPGKVGEALRDSRETIETVIALTTIQTELPYMEWDIRPGVWSEESLSQWGSLANFPHWMGRFNFLADIKGADFESVGSVFSEEPSFIPVMVEVGGTEQSKISDVDGAAHPFDESE